MRATAIYYASLGYRCLPLINGGKIPACEHGCHDATTDPERLAPLFQRDELNLGIATGHALMVLDVDQHGVDGEATLAALERQHGPLPATVEATTPSGGRHLYFATGSARVASSAGKIGPGLDVRGEGGYVAAPPSQTPQGTYEWVLAPGGRKPAPAPAWLLDLAGGAAAPKERIDRRVEPVPDGAPIPDGQRNATLASIAGGLHRAGLSRDLLCAELERHNARCQPPLPEREVQRIVASVARYPTQAETDRLNFEWGKRACSHLVTDAKGSGVGDTDEGCCMYPGASAASIRTRPRTSWLVHRLLPEKSLCAIVGSPGAGKTYLALDLAGAIADGREWFGHHVKQRPVLYFCLESPYGLETRLDAWYRDKGSEHPARFEESALNLADSKCVKGLAASVAPGTVIVVDTLAAASVGAEENSGKDMGVLISNCKALIAATGGTVVLVHHLGKDATKGARGHSSLFGALDSQITVKRTEAGRRWTSDKIKEGRDDLEHLWDLKEVDLGLDDDGLACSSCVVESTGESAPKVEVPKPLGERARKARTAFFGALKVSPHETPGGYAVHIADWSAKYREIFGNPNKTSTKQAFYHGKKELIARGEIQLDSNLNIYTGLLAREVAQATIRNTHIVGCDIPPGNGDRGSPGSLGSLLVVSSD